MLFGAFEGCSVFEPPPDSSDSSIGPTGGKGGSGGGATGGSTSGGTGGGGNAGASASGGGGSGGSSGVAGQSGGGQGGSAGGDASVDSGDAAGGTGGGPCTGPLGPWWRYTNSDQCESEGVPSSADRPSLSCDGASIAPFFVAMTRIRFGNANDDPALTPNDDAWQEIGFDLDRTCTSSPTCRSDDAPILNPGCKNDDLVPFDGLNCRDNQIGKLFPIAALSPIVGGLFGMGERNWNCALHRGEFSVVFRVSDYNGQSIDPSVRFDMYTSVGLPSGLPSWECLKPDGTVSDNWHNQAPWLPIEHFTIARRSLALNDPDAGTQVPNAKAADPAAFVRGGYLFAELPPGAEFWLDGERASTPGFRLIIRRGVLTGKLAKQLDGTWTLEDGTVAAVVLPGELVQAFREIGFCQNMCDAYSNVINYLNIALDTLSTSSTPLPDAPCDSSSIGMSFEARQMRATAADIVDVDPPVDCPPPRHPDAPPHGCVCPSGGGQCQTADAGTDGG
jgi:hypothetical protein